MPSLTTVLGPSPGFASTEKKGWSCKLSTAGSCDSCASVEQQNDAATDVAPTPLKEQATDLPRLHVVTVTTHADGYFTSLAYSSLLLQSGLRVLGWGEKWKGFGMKQIKLVEYCRQVPPGDVVMLVDGFDSVILQPNEVILRKFLEFGKRIVVSGESRSNSFLSQLFLMFHNCVFKSPTAKHWPKPLPYVNKDVNVRLLNAGGLIGYAEDLINLFEGFEYSWNDQRFLSAVFMEEPHKLVTIDANCSIFALYRTRKQYKFLTYEEAEKEARHVVPYFPDDPEYNEEAARRRCPAPNFRRSALRGVVMDVVTRETPCVLHMYCRRNADALVEKVGLPKGEHIWHPSSLLWYIFFSLHGTLLHSSKGTKTGWHMPYVIALSSAILGGTGLVGLLLNAMIYLASLSTVRGAAYRLQQRGEAVLAPLMAPLMLPNHQMRIDMPSSSTGPEVGVQPAAHSSWLLALQLLTHLASIPAASLSRPCLALISIIVQLLPVFVAFALAGALVLGAFLHMHGGYGDEDEADAAASVKTAAMDRPAPKSEKRE